MTRNANTFAHSYTASSERIPAKRSLTEHGPPDKPGAAVLLLNNSLQNGLSGRIRVSFPNTSIVAENAQHLSRPVCVRAPCPVIPLWQRRNSHVSLTGGRSCQAAGGSQRGRDSNLRPIGL